MSLPRPKSLFKKLKESTIKEWVIIKCVLQIFLKISSFYTTSTTRRITLVILYSSKIRFFSPVLLLVWLTNLWSLPLSCYILKKCGIQRTNCKKLSFFHIQLGYHKSRGLINLWNLIFLEAVYYVMLTFKWPTTD